jgi:hypothetical protein
MQQAHPPALMLLLLQRGLRSLFALLLLLHVRCSWLKQGLWQPQEQQQQQGAAAWVLLACWCCCWRQAGPSASAVATAGSNDKDNSAYVSTAAAVLYRLHQQCRGN